MYFALLFNLYLQHKQINKNKIMGITRVISSSSNDNSGSRSMLGNKSSSSLETVIVKEYESLPNPRPDNYTIVRHKIIRKHLIIEIKYHDCKNYEGKKVMIFKCTLEDLINQKLIDPHFCDNGKYYSPIARFEPTEEGWINACTMAVLIHSKNYK